MNNRVNIERRFWDSFAGKYDRFINKTVGKAYSQMELLLSEDVKGSVNLLELATGTGLLAFRLSNYVKHIVATDLAPAMIEQAKIKQRNSGIGNISFELADICGLPYANETYDCVLASNVLHLLFDPGKAIGEMKRVVKQDGKIIIPTFCHGENLKSRLISAFMNFAGFRARTRWTTIGFKKFLEDNGLKIIRYSKIESKIPLVYIVAVKKSSNYIQN